MNENAEKLKELFKKKSAEAGKVSELEELRIEFLGKKGHIANLMSELRALPNDQKKEAGQKINTIKQFIESSMQERLQELKALEEQRLIDSAEVYDESFPCDTNPGSYSPITLVQREVDEIFLNMGFSIEDYSEVTDDYNCFEALNIPKHHPARDMQDTYYLSNGQLLKTHTSAAQNTILRKYAADLEKGIPRTLLQKREDRRLPREYFLPDGRHDGRQGHINFEPHLFHEDDALRGFPEGCHGAPAPRLLPVR